MTPARPSATAGAFVLLLRGINVGGNKVVPMAELKRLLEGLGFADVRTLLNSGNAVVRGPAARTDTMERALEQALARRFGFEVGCTVRSAAEWTRIVAANLMPAEAKRDPGRLHVYAMALPPAPRAVTALRAAIPGREVVAASGRELWAWFPDGAGRSRLTLPLIERTLGSRGTGRNWNTVLKLAAMLES